VSASHASVTVLLHNAEFHWKGSVFLSARLVILLLPCDVSRKKFTLLVSGRMPEPADAKFMPVVILFLWAF